MRLIPDLSPSRARGWPKRRLASDVAVQANYNIGTLAIKAFDLSDLANTDASNPFNNPYSSSSPQRPIMLFPLATLSIGLLFSTLVSSSTTPPKVATTISIRPRSARNGIDLEAGSRDFERARALQDTLSLPFRIFIPTRRAVDVKPFDIQNLKARHQTGALAMTDHSEICT